MIFTPTYEAVYLEKLWIAVGLCVLGTLRMVWEMMGRKMNKPKLKVMELKSHPVHYSTPMSKPPCELDISKLDISSPGKKDDSLKSSGNRSSGFIRPKPVISPSRFTKSNLS